MRLQRNSIFLPLSSTLNASLAPSSYTIITTYPPPTQARVPDKDPVHGGSEGRGSERREGPAGGQRAEGPPAGVHGGRGEPCRCSRSIFVVPDISEQLQICISGSRSSQLSNPQVEAPG